MKSVTDHADVAKHIEYVNDRPYNDLRYPMDSSKLCELGWSPKVSWEDGINKTSMSNKLY